MKSSLSINIISRRSKKKAEGGNEEQVEMRGMEMSIFSTGDARAINVDRGEVMS